MFLITRTNCSKKGARSLTSLQFFVFQPKCGAHTLFDTARQNVLSHLHLPQQVFLMLVEVSREFHVVGDDQVAKGSIATVVALSEHAHFRTVLRTGFHLQFDLCTIAQSDDDITAQEHRIHVEVDRGVHLARMLARLLRAKAT